MQAAYIRHKYSQILDQPESENSSDEEYLSRKRTVSHKRVLSEVNREHSPQDVLAVKQKLAQSISVSKDLNKDVMRLNARLQEKENEKRSLEERIAHLNQTIQQQKQTVSSKNEAIKNLQAHVQRLSSNLQEMAIDRDLHQKQTDFYKNECQKIKSQLEIQEIKYSSIFKDIRNADKIKRQNDYLKTDLERLSTLIEHSLRFNNISPELLSKHFLGKPYREIDFWYPQQLIGETELFLKKQQVGYGNREFTNSLIKFISKLIQKSSKRKVSMSHSRTKEKESFSLKKPLKTLNSEATKKNTFHLGTLRDEVLMKSNSSFWKSSETRPMCNESFRMDIPDSSGNGSSSHNGGSVSAVKSYCWDVIEEFRSVVFELLLEKEVKRKKIKKLIDQMASGVFDLLDSLGGNRELSSFDIKIDAESKVQTAAFK